MDLSKPKIEHLENLGHQMTKLEINKLKLEMQSKQTKINQIEAQMDEVHISHTLQIRDLETLTQNLKKDIENLKEDSQKKDSIIDKLKHELILVKEESNNKFESLTNEILKLENIMKVKNKGSKNALQKKSSFGLEDESKTDISKENIDIPDYETNFNAGNRGRRLSRTRRIHSKCVDFVAYEWRICDFVKRREEAISQFNTKLYSETFYSHEKGYKLRLRVNPNGFGDVENTHLSVFFSIIKGENDDTLYWPMQRQITVALIDQSSGEEFVSDKYKLTSIDDKKFEVIFDKPSKRIIKDDDYYYYGTPNFIELNRLLNNKNLIKNGYIILRCFFN